MTKQVLLSSTLVLLCGCSGIEASAKRPPTPSPAPAQPASSQPAAPPAAPVAAPPPAAPSSAAGKTGAQPRQGPLRPELSAEQEQRLVETTRQNIGDVERLLNELAGRQMKAPQQEALRTAQSFLDQARSALKQRDYQRAANLASKARALTDELAGATKTNK